MNADSVGARLKKIRLEKGLSLDDVHKNTKINLTILRAIEEDNIIGFSPIYIKGFVKIYCKFLGVDPKEYIADYKDPAVSQKVPIETKKVTQKESKRELVKKSVEVDLGPLRPSKKVRTIALAVFVLVVGSLLLFKIGKVSSSKRAVSLPEAKITPRKPVKQNTGKVASAKSKQEAKTPSAAAIVSKAQPAETKPVKKEIPVSQGVRVTILAKEDCWLTVKVDGKTAFQSVLKKGRSESWPAKEKVELSAGSASAIELQVNGQLFSNLGRRGTALKNVVITKDGLNIPR